MRVAGRVLACFLLCILAACGGGRDTPREAYESLRSALATADGAAVYELHDAESRAFYRAHVRQQRALLARGDDPAKVLTHPEQTPELFLEGDEASAVERMVASFSDIATTWPWMQEAVVVEEVLEDDAHARLRLRGLDGVEMDLHFVREASGWAHDAYRQFKAR